MRVFISAGEASGDALGAHLIDALKARVPDLQACGMGGPQMVERGFTAFRDANSIGVVGLVEVLRHLPRLFRLRDELADYAIAQKPDVAVLIDVPDFNIRLAKKLKAAGVTVVFYVGPSVWAWRSGRAKRYARYIDRLLVLFPFEVPIWQAAGVDVVCVGHPLLDEIPIASPPVASRTIALLPGSRAGEIARHLDTLLAAAAKLRERGVADRFVLPLAPSVPIDPIQAAVEASDARGSVELVIGTEPRRAAIASSCLALVASGTATLETALIGRPQIVIYRVSWLTWWLMKPFVKVAFLGLVNLIAGREIAPELLQRAFSPGRVADEAARLLQSPGDAMAGLAEVRSNLGDTGVADRAAAGVLSLPLSGSIR